MFVDEAAFTEAMRFQHVDRPNDSSSSSLTYEEFLHRYQSAPREMLEKFNPYRRDAQATVSDQPIVPVPLHRDVYYNPDHPDADWAGLVKTISGAKRHPPAEHLQLKQHLQQQEEGIISTEVPKFEFHKKKVSNVHRGETNLIGGIAPDQKFKTIYHSLTEGNNNQNNNNTNNHKSRGRPQLPSTEKPESSTTQNNSSYSSVPSLTSSNGASRYSGNLTGKSFLGNLGSDLVKQRQQKQ